MKRNYIKPDLVIEELMIDMPSARGCDYQSPDYQDMKDFGYFTSEIACRIPADLIEWGDNTVCLNTNVIIALTS